MKMLSVFYQGNEISVHNSCWGVETVRYNGQKMTSAFSWWGKTHRFSVMEGNEQAQYTIIISMNWNSWNLISIDVYRNEEPLSLSGSRNTPALLRPQTHPDEFV